MQALHLLVQLPCPLWACAGAHQEGVRAGQEAGQHSALTTEAVQPWVLGRGDRLAGAQLACAELPHVGLSERRAGGRLLLHVAEPAHAGASRS